MNLIVGCAGSPKQRGVIIWNVLQFEPRVPLAFAISHDHCKTWSRPVIVTKQAGYMYNIFFSDKEMFITHLEGTGKDTRAEGFGWRGVKLVIYDLKDVLALQPKK